MDAPPGSKESQKNHPAFPCNWSDQISQQFNLCPKFYEELFSATSTNFNNLSEFLHDLETLYGPHILISTAVFE